MTSLYAGHNIPEDPAISHLKPTGGNTPSVYQKLYHGGKFYHRQLFNKMKWAVIEFGTVKEFVEFISIWGIKGRVMNASDLCVEIIVWSLETWFHSSNSDLVPWNRTLTFFTLLEKVYDLKTSESWIIISYKLRNTKYI